MSSSPRLRQCSGTLFFKLEELIFNARQFWLDLTQEPPLHLRPRFRGLPPFFTDVQSLLAAAGVNVSLEAIISLSNLSSSFEKLIMRIWFSQPRLAALSIILVIFWLSTILLYVENQPRTDPWMWFRGRRLCEAYRWISHLSGHLAMMTLFGLRYILVVMAFNWMAAGSFLLAGLIINLLAIGEFWACRPVYNEQQITLAEPGFLEPILAIFK